MSRRIRGGGTITVPGAVLIGASDTTTGVLNTALTSSCIVTAPMDGCQLIQMNLLTKVVGGTTGTFSVQVLAGSGNQALTAATATTFIDADAAVGSAYQVDGLPSGTKLAYGDQLKIATVKSGTVSTGVTFEVLFIFAIAP